MKCDLILALDLPDESEAMALLDRLEGELDVIKIGLQLFTRYGPALVESLTARGFELDVAFYHHRPVKAKGRAVPPQGRRPRARRTRSAPRPGPA